MLTGGLQINGVLAFVWIAPAAVALIALATSGGPRSRQRRLVRSGVVLLLVGYVVAASILILWPLEFDISALRLRDGNWRPFEGTIGWYFSPSNGVQEMLGGRDFWANVILFVPFGLLFPYVAAKRWTPIASIVLIVGLAFGFELTQGIFVAARTFDIDDAITGAAAGVAVAVVASIFTPFIDARNKR